MVLSLNNKNQNKNALNWSEKWIKTFGNRKIYLLTIRIVSQKYYLCLPRKSIFCSTSSLSPVIKNNIKYFLGLRLICVPFVNYQLNTNSGDVCRVIINNFMN